MYFQQTYLIGELIRYSAPEIRRVAMRWFGELRASGPGVAAALNRATEYAVDLGTKMPSPPRTAEDYHDWSDAWRAGVLARFAADPPRRHLTAFGWTLGDIRREVSVLQLNVVLQASYRVDRMEQILLSAEALQVLGMVWEPDAMMLGRWLDTREARRSWLDVHEAIEELGTIAVTGGSVLDLRQLDTTVRQTSDALEKGVASTAQRLSDQ